LACSGAAHCRLQRFLRLTQGPLNTVHCRRHRRCSAARSRSAVERAGKQRSALVSSRATVALATRHHIMPSPA
jgi:hypothetical protein